MYTNFQERTKTDIKDSSAQKTHEVAGLKQCVCGFLRKQPNIWGENI